jgi:hypothetical protein
VKPDQLIPPLEALAGRLGITLRYEGLAQSGVSGTGGLCKVRGAHWLLIDKKSTPSERVAILVDALASFDTEAAARDLGLSDKIEEMLSARRAAKSQSAASGV